MGGGAFHPGSLAALDHARIGIALGILTLVAAAMIARVPLAIRREDVPKVLIAGFFNVAAFGVGSAYAQIYGTTSRAIVIAYSMPIWSALLGCLC